MNAFRYSILSLVFSDGRQVDLSPSDIVLVVGANNAGKSRVLRDIISQIDHESGADPNCVVVKKVTISVSEDANTLNSFAASLDQGHGHAPSLARMGSSMTLSSFSQWLTYDGDKLRKTLRRGLRAFTTYLVNTENRLNITQPVPAIDLDSAQKSHPFHYLQDDVDLEEEMSRIFKKAFGTDLIVNRTAGATVHVHVGQRPGDKPTYDTSKPVRTAISSLPKLSEQGDGMRAFVGCLMWGTVAKYNIILIDEPEAFLHPPQARLLGRTLVQKRPSGTQLFLATHSGDILRGALDAAAARLRILRLVRDGSVNRVTELAPEDVLKLSSDSLLRQTNVLDALFHQQTIVCESDSDCQFYSEMMRTLSDADEARANPDVLYLQSYGKSRLAAVAAPLRKLGVPVKIVADFDVLREEQPLRSIFEALGGEWSNISDDWRTVVSAVSQKKAQLDKADLERTIRGALDKVVGTVVPDSALKEIKDAAKKASAWADAKTMGEAFLPAGDITNRYRRLTGVFKGVGLFIVPNGELESFYKSVARHGPAWVEEVCKRNFTSDPELRDAREFVQELIWGS